MKTMALLIIQKPKINIKLKKIIVRSNFCVRQNHKNNGD